MRDGDWLTCFFFILILLDSPHFLCCVKLENEIKENFTSGKFEIKKCIKTIPLFARLAARSAKERKAKSKIFFVRP